VAVSVADRVDRLDLSLFDEIEGLASSADRRSLLALHAALATRGPFGYLEIGSYLGGSLQSFTVDPRCRAIVSIDRRDDVSEDERSELPEYPGNTTPRMLERLSRLSGADLGKLTAIDGSTDQLDPGDYRADLCLIDGQHTNAAVLGDARFCRQVIRDRGVIVFHDRTLVDDGIRQFLAELPMCRMYPLAHELFVVEINVPSLLSDARLKRQVPRAAWVIADRFRAVRPALAVGSAARRLESRCGRAALALGAPRRRKGAESPEGSPGNAPFEIHTFVTDDRLHEAMVTSFTDAGFDPDSFVRLTDANDDPYAAITRIGRESRVRYPILCHQDVRTDCGPGADDLLAAVAELDRIDPFWVVAGNAGCMRTGQGVRRLVDRFGKANADPREPLPRPVVSLDENFLIFNGRNPPSCSAGLSGFHLYGTDVCLRALSSGGAAYVIDFPVTHLGGPTDGAAEAARTASLEAAKNRFIEIWGKDFRFCYVLTPSTGFFVSRSRLLRRLFGSDLAMTCVAQGVRSASLRNRPD